MAAKSEPDLIDELLRQDEEELRQKKKRLREFATALDGLRDATTAAQKAASVLLDAGDLSRAELGKVFGLSRGERAIMVPAQGRSAAGSADTVDQQTDAADAPDHQLSQQEDQSAEH